MGTATEWYVDLLHGRGRAAQDTNLVAAARGDTAALRRFLHSPYREGEGEFSEVWVADMVFLLLCYDDRTMLDVLRTESPEIRHSVAQVIGVMLDPTDRARYAQTYAFCAATRKA